MSGQNTNILLTDYNSIQSSISSVLGVGGSPDSSYGYNQTVLSSPVSAYAAITATQWVNLQSDIIRTRRHQTGTNVTLNPAGSSFTGSISGTTLTVTAVSYGAIVVGHRIGGNSAIPSNVFVSSFGSGIGGTGTYTLQSAATIPGGTNMLSSSVVAESDRLLYAAMVASCITDRLVAPLTQLSLDTVTSANYTNSWQTLLTHTSTVTFADGNTCRGFFNAGGYFMISASRTGGSVNIKNTSWTTMLTNMKTITFGRTTTSVTGTGTAYVVGYTTLTTTDQLIFQKLTETSIYSPNQYDIYVRQGTSSAQLIFTVQFQDLSAPSGYGIDEFVDGTVNSLVQEYRPSGVNVSISTPLSTTTFTGS